MKLIVCGNPHSYKEQHSRWRSAPDVKVVSLGEALMGARFDEIALTGIILRSYEEMQCFREWVNTALATKMVPTQPSDHNLDS